MHDMVEDTSVTLLQIYERYGRVVGDTVDGLTDPPAFAAGVDMSPLERKTKQAARVRTKHDYVKRVKLADQISNLGIVASDPPVGWSKPICIEYIEGARRVGFECLGLSSYLDELFRTAHETAVRVYE